MEKTKLHKKATPMPLELYCSQRLFYKNTFNKILNGIKTKHFNMPIKFGKGTTCSEVVTEIFHCVQGLGWHVLFHRDCVEASLHEYCQETVSFPHFLFLIWCLAACCHRHTFFFSLVFLDSPF